MTDNEKLAEKLRERAASYRMGGPSSEHTAALLDRAADALSATPPALLDRAALDRAADALSATPRNVAPLSSWNDPMTDPRICDLELLRAASSCWTALDAARVEIAELTFEATQWKKNTRLQETRAEQAEAEIARLTKNCDNWQQASVYWMGKAHELQAQAAALRALANKDPILKEHKPEPEHSNPAYLADKELKP